ncbi:MAG: hypothetical protein HKO92_09785, partial [Flavobacteriaceae bacterium]|nr:hypothetical protein [Flavobacteriaceae bacterium]
MRISYYKLLLISTLFFYSNVNSQNQTNAQRLQQLPPGNELLLKFNSLSPQAKLKAENWLNNFDFPDQDFKNIDIDDEGGVFYFDPINNKDNK